MTRNTVPLYLVLCVLATACTQVASPVPQVEQTYTPPTPAVVPSQRDEAQEMRNLLSKLDADTVTGSLTSRFLQSGIYEIGHADAPLNLVIVDEYHCTYCQDFWNEQFPRLREEFILPGILKIQLLHIPLQKYSNSLDATKAMYCAGRLGKAWSMHFLLLERQNKHRSSLLEYAKELNMDPEFMTACMDHPDTRTQIDLHTQIATQADALLVPTFILNGEKKTGLQYYADLRGWIEKKGAEN